jgi:hypothetical protein
MVFEHMRKQDWLYHYRLKKAYNSFVGLVRRAAIWMITGKHQHIRDELWVPRGISRIFPPFEDRSRKYPDGIINSPELCSKHELLF